MTKAKTSKTVKKEAKRNVLVCTAWPYAYATPHLGNFLSIISGCVFKRYYTHKGDNVLHVSGSDAHGAKIEYQAYKEKTTPKELALRIHKNIESLNHAYNIDFDNYTWTEAPTHVKFTQETYKKAYDNGFIITKTEKKPYCRNCTTFLADRFITGECPSCAYPDAQGNQCDKCGRLLEPEELKNPVCAQCGKKDIIIKETKHWYIALDKLQSKLKKYADSHPEWNDITKEYTYRLLNEGLQARPVTRDIKWGISAPFPGSEGKTIYVWAEAVLGYISATIEYAERNGTPDAWKNYWLKPCKQVYSQGKDNIPFHTVIFPGILLATGINYTLPSQMSAIYFLNWEGGLKFSKTNKIGVWADEALDILPNPDVWRFHLMLNRPEKRDREFSWTEFEKTINMTLVGSIGNLYNRCLTILNKEFKGKLPKEELESRIEKKIKDTFTKSSKILEEGIISEALNEIISLSDFANEYFQKNEPWHNPKTAPKTIYNCYQVLQALTILLEPFTPATSTKAWKMLGMKSEIRSTPWEFNEVKNATIEKPELLYTKVEEGELKVKQEKMRSMKANVKDITEKSSKTATQNQDASGLINYETFSKVKLTTAKIISAEPFGNKLIKLKVQADRERTILAGLKAYYTPEELIGKTVIIAANLEPKKLAGEMSDGMVLAAEKNGKVVVLTVDAEVGPGADIH